MFSFLVREEINMVMLDDEIKLFSPSGERRKPFKKSPCKRVSLVSISETPKNRIYRKD